MSVVVVYVHGLWQTGRESLWLRRRLARELDAETHVFSYRSIVDDVTANARALGEFLATIRADTLHLIGHSLGGLVILKHFELKPGAPLPPGRIVLLGSPLRGCRTARNLSRWSWGRTVLGRGIHEEALVERRRIWAGERELGVIAGDLGVGLGRLVGRMEVPSDGTVSVEETHLEGTKDRVVLRVSHTGMVFSAAVAHQAAAFLGSGKFDR
jgi:pimeloyl-ACP methyl ester carboxylesterase